MTNEKYNIKPQERLKTSPMADYNSIEIFNE